MTSAEIVGDDFVVHGHLFPWNQADRVSTIQSNKELLGMSMNANVIGHHGEIQGKSVLFIDEMEMLGANILLQDRATYAKTRIIEAQVCASKPTNTHSDNGDPEDMGTIEELTKSVQDLVAASQEQSRAMSQQLELMAQKQSQLEQELRDVENFRKQAEAKEEARRKQEQEETVQAQKQQDNNQLVEAIMSGMQQVIDRSLPPSRRQPLRAVPTPPANLTNLGGVQSAPQQEIMASKMLELQRAEGALEYARSQGTNSTERFKLVDDVRRLKAELGM